jgi:hypothetical protein
MIITIAFYYPHLFFSCKPAVIKYRNNCCGYSLNTGIKIGH